MPSRRSHQTDAPDTPTSGTWTVTSHEDRTGMNHFERWYHSLAPYYRAVVVAVFRRIVAPMGIDICATGWGKPLGDGLYEIRIRKSLNAILRSGPQSAEDSVEGGDQTVLLRIFCTFEGEQVVILFQGYDKEKEPSKRKQRREINKARKLLKDRRSH